MTYLSSIWQARYFWLHLARAELKYKFRRSKLGILWTMINPLILTLMMSVIFGNVFGYEMREFAPYVFTGLIVWDFVLQSVLGGCQSLIGGESYIKQFKHPMAIYPLKTVLVNLATFSLAFLGVLIWTLFTNPGNVLLGILFYPVMLICLFFIGFPASIVAAYINLKFRDFAQIIALVMQLIWYMSPVFFNKSLFSSPALQMVFEYNPVTHILNLVRAPVLYGTLPTGMDFLFIFGLSAVLFGIAIYLIRTRESNLIFYF